VSKGIEEIRHFQKLLDISENTLAFAETQEISRDDLTIGEVKKFF
jgi:hypothetical protein